MTISEASTRSSASQVEKIDGSRRALMDALESDLGSIEVTVAGQIDKIAASGRAISQSLLSEFEGVGSAGRHAG